jgi:hypothetical protein
VVESLLQSQSAAGGEEAPRGEAAKPAATALKQAAWADGGGGAGRAAETEELRERGIRFATAAETAGGAARGVRGVGAGVAS